MYFYVQKARLEIIDFEMTLGRKILKNWDVCFYLFSNIKIYKTVYIKNKPIDFHATHFT